MKFADIDIGSNALRLLLTRVFEGGNPPVFKKEALVRIPLRPRRRSVYAKTAF